MLIATPRCPQMEYNILESKAQRQRECASDDVVLPTKMSFCLTFLWFPPSLRCPPRRSWLKAWWKMFQLKAGARWPWWALAWSAWPLPWVYCYRWGKRNAILYYSVGWGNRQWAVLFNDKVFIVFYWSKRDKRMWDELHKVNMNLGKMSLCSINKDLWIWYQPNV